MYFCTSFLKLHRRKLLRISKEIFIPNVFTICWEVCSGFLIIGTGLSANKSSTSCICTACPKLWTSMDNYKLLTTCNNVTLVDVIRLVARLFQQVCYSLDISILLQPCVVNLATFLLYHDCMADLLEQPCNKSDNAIKLVTSC
jgi:hypothetical protein